MCAPPPLVLIGIMRGFRHFQSLISLVSRPPSRGITHLADRGHNPRRIESIHFLLGVGSGANSSGPPRHPTTRHVVFQLLWPPTRQVSIVVTSRVAINSAFARCVQTAQTGAQIQPTIFQAFKAWLKVTPDATPIIDPAATTPQATRWSQSRNASRRTPDGAAGTEEFALLRALREKNHRRRGGSNNHTIRRAPSTAVVATRPIIEHFLS